MRNDISDKKAVSAIKEWLTPSLITIVGVMLWSQITELKQDVKTLLVSISATDTKLAMLEKEVDYLRANNISNEYNTGESRMPFQRAIPKKEDGPKVPDPEPSDKQRN